MRVYKFVHPDRVDVLSGQRIRFSQPSDLNDPFETRPHIRAISDNPDLENVVGDLLSEERLRAKYDALADSWKVGMYSTYDSFRAWMLANKEEAKNLVLRNNEFDGPGGSRREFEETVRAFFDD